MKSTYVNLLLEEWAVGEHSVKLQKAVKRVLSELCAEAQLLLRRQPKLQVEVMQGETFHTWAYFPAHPRRFQRRFPRLRLRPQARILLIISAPGDDVKRWPQTEMANYLRHHFGHTLLYLRKPKARNECLNAQREWRMSCDPPHNAI